MSVNKKKTGRKCERGAAENKLTCVICGVVYTEHGVIEHIPGRNHEYKKV